MTADSETRLHTTQARAELIDSYGHMNNAAYLTLMEEARWAFISNRGFSAAEIAKNRLGPVVLEV